MHNKKLFGTATVGTRGQVVIPADARKELNIEEGQRLYVIGSKNNSIIGLIPEDRLQEIIQKMSGEIEALIQIQGSK